MTEPEQIASSRSRGRGFPTMPLDEAVSVIKKAGQYGHEHSVATFAGYLGHGTTNSGPFRAKMAALKDWGLIQRRGEAVLLTELAASIAHPESSTAEGKSLRDAFRQAEPFGAVYEESAKGTELNLDLIGNRAVTVFGVAPKSKKKFAESFAQSAIMAGLARMSSESTVELLTERDHSQSQEADHGDSGHQTKGGLSPAPPSTVPPATTASPTLHQEWPVDGGTIIFQAALDRPLPAAVYADIANIANAIERLVEHLDGLASVHEPEQAADVSE